MSKITTKIMAASFGMTALFTAQSAQAGVDGNPFENFYVGFTLNTTQHSAASTYKQTGPEVAANPNANPPVKAVTSSFDSITGTTGKRGYAGGIYGGYGINFGPIYTSAEAGFYINRGSTKVTDGKNTFGIGGSNSFDVNARVGFVAADRFLVYGLIGYAATKFSTHDFATKSSERLNGLRYGGGFEVGIMENIALRAEYTQVRYGTMTVTQGIDQFTFKPKAKQFGIGLVLHMN